MLTGKQTGHGMVSTNLKAANNIDCRFASYLGSDLMFSESDIFEFDIRVGGFDNRQDVLENLIVRQAEQIGLFAFKAKSDEAHGEMRPLNNRYLFSMGVDCSSKTR